jgi:hypothetical protein
MGEIGMKQYKFISVVLLSILLISIGNMTISATTAGIQNDHNLEAIQAARNYHLAEELFLHDFNEKLTRQELAMLMITMLEKLSYKNIKTVAQVMQIFYEYNDKPLPTSIYVPYIYLASKAGIVESISKNKFNPHGLVTRQMFASVLFRAIILAKPLKNYFIRDDIKFTDDKKIYDWARPGIIFAVKNKYMFVTTKNEINPRGYITREQALEIIYNVLIKENAVPALTVDQVKRAKGELPLILVKGKDQKWGYSDGAGKVVIKTQFDSAKDFSEGVAAVNMNGKWGFTDSAGNILVKPEYDRVHDFHNGYAAVTSGTKFGYVDNTGKVILKLQYLSDNEFLTDLYDFSNESSFVKLEFNKYRLIDKAGKALYKQGITYARHFSEGLAAIKVNNKFCYINNKGKVVIKLDAEVTTAGDFHDSRAVICMNNSLYHYIDKKGKILK